MQYLVKILSTHNIIRHLRDAEGEFYDNYVRGEKISAQPFLQTDKSLPDFSLSKEDEILKQEGYQDISFFRKYLLKNYFTPTYLFNNNPNYLSDLNNELKNACQLINRIEIAFDPDFTYKIRLSRNGYFNFIIEKEIEIEDSSLEQIKNYISCLLNDEGYKTLLSLVPLLLSHRFLKNIVAAGEKNEKCSPIPFHFFEHFYEAPFFIKEKDLPQHPTYFIIQAKSIVLETEEKIKSLLIQEDIFDIKNYGEKVYFNPNSYAFYDDNICFIAKTNASGNEKETIAINSFIRTFEFLFSLRTEFEYLKKETTKMLESIAEISLKIAAQSSIHKTQKHQKPGQQYQDFKIKVDKLILDLSKFYRMLPHLQDILAGSTVFRNLKVISIVKDISKTFYLLELEFWVSKNIQEINNFITYFHSIMEQREEKNLNFNLNLIFFILSFLAIPSFIQDLFSSFSLNSFQATLFYIILYALWLALFISILLIRRGRKKRTGVKGKPKFDG